MMKRFEEFTSNIALAYKYIIKIKACEMSEFGLKASNVTCLFFLGKYEEGLTMAELCDVCMEDKAAVSKSIAFLKEKGYVEQEKGNKKYKAKYLITASGRAVFEEVKGKIDKVVDKVGEGITEEERNSFYRTLGKMVSNLGELVGDKK